MYTVSLERRLYATQAHYLLHFVAPTQSFCTSLEVHKIPKLNSPSWVPVDIYRTRTKLREVRFSGGITLSVGYV